MQYSSLSPLALAALLAACGGGGGSGGTGTLQVALTDAPACGFSEVNVTVSKVRVHSSSTANETDGGWSEIVLSPAMELNLLDLQNGVLQDLGQVQLPAGQYQQMRLVLEDANVVPEGSSTPVPVSTPSGQQTGLKMNLDVTVSEDKIADVVIDFDACKSFVKRGNGQYALKPVLRADVVLSDAGQRVVGYMAAASAPTVSLQAAGEVVKSAAPDANGQFVLYPVPPGTYDLVLTAEGRVTSVITGVPVVTTAYTTIGSSTAKIDTPVSIEQRVANGMALPASAQATVHAFQTVGATTVEATAQVVDAAGAYSFTLPIEAPAWTAYVPGAVTWTWTRDDAQAGKYRLDATAEARITQTADIVLAAPQVTTNFVFP